ncbi:hypothetical protein L2735_18165 [Shewanella olleyana]|uniref:hypothetical protein n=1 Tax=Shewanella olleyana TaxID=135626 RepID=UPI00200FBCCE|nr:hypothetical protein [Shewanella olleyana]MCL1068697.1 hypothetical protein [Shewanella olleyana]
MAEQEQIIANLLKDMEETAEKIRVLINEMPPEDLLGYIYAQRLMTSSNATLPELESDIPKDEINEVQFLLEYVHAVLASDIAPDEMVFDESKCGELYALSRSLREKSIFLL